MRPMSQHLIALLNSKRSHYYAELFELVTVGGLTIRLTSGDTDIVYNSEVFYADGVNAPLLSSDVSPDVSEKVGLEVSTLTFELLGAKYSVGTSNFQQACILGLLDGATVRVWRMFMPVYGDTSRGGILKFVGLVSDIEVHTSFVSVSVSSFTELLNNNWPRNVYQGGCLNNLGDPTCGVDLSAHTQTKVIVSESTRTTLYATLTGSTPNPFTFGVVLFTSGVLTGVMRSVRLDDIPTGRLELMHPLPATPSIGDAFSLSLGCNKSYISPDGCAKFANLSRFRGMPFIPAAEMSV